MICSARITKTIPTHRGFTLVELMVTVAIVVLVTGIALVRYGSFNNSVLLKSQAYEIALDLRAAQTYGVSVSGQNAGELYSAYGLYFDLSTPNSYQLFQDENGNRTMDTGEAVGETYLIDPRFTLSAITTDGSCSSPTRAAVTFERPNFDAQVYVPGCAGVTPIGIELTPVRDATEVRTVTVSPSGYVMVE